MKIVDGHYISDLGMGFYFSAKEEDCKAYNLLKEHDIPCRFLGKPFDAPTPMLSFGAYDHIVGYNKIKSFVEEWVKEEE